jgi:hypothetical protein
MQDKSLSLKKMRVKKSTGALILTILTPVNTCLFATGRLTMAYVNPARVPQGYARVAASTAQQAKSGETVTGVTPVRDSANFGQKSQVSGSKSDVNWHGTVTNGFFGGVIGLVTAYAVKAQGLKAWGILGVTTASMLALGYLYDKATAFLSSRNA